MSINADPYGLPEGGTTTLTPRAEPSCADGQCHHLRTGQLVLSVAQSGSDQGLKCFDTLVKARSVTRGALSGCVVLRRPLLNLQVVCNALDKPTESTTWTRSN